MNGPDLDTIRSLSEKDTILETLQSLEFVSPFDTPDEFEADPSIILNKIMDGSNEIGISLHSFLRHFMPPAYKRKVALHKPDSFSNELWKRELLGGEVTLFHPETVAAAIRLRPDLLPDIASWFDIFIATDVFVTSHAEIITEIAPENAEQEAALLIDGALKFAKFLHSKIPTMTVILRGEIFQIKKNNAHHYFMSVAKDEVMVDGRVVTWDHIDSLDGDIDGATLTSTILIERNQVLAIGANETIDQIFDRKNLGKMRITELVEVPDTQTQNAETTINEESNIDDPFCFDIPQITPVAEKIVPLTEDLFDLITSAVSLTCSSRTLMAVSIMITDKQIKLTTTARRLHDVIRVNTGLIKTPTFQDFVIEIELLEREAQEKVEHRILTECLDHLGLSLNSMSDPLAKKMTDLLVAGARQRLGFETDFDYGRIWHELTVMRRKSEFFLRAAVEQYRTKKDLTLKFGGKWI